MNTLLRWILRRRLGVVEARVFESEMGELYRHKVETDGRAAADSWRRRESLLAALRAITMRAALPSSPAQRRPHALRGIASIGLDIRYGLRTLRKRPFFTALVVGTLGLGIGASTIVFSLVDGILLEELPYEEPGELVNVWQTYPTWRDQELLREAWDKIGFTWAEVQSLSDTTEVLATVAAHRTRTVVLTSFTNPERLRAGEATPSLFPLLGLRPLLGRVFLPSEAGPAAARVTILSHSLWSTRFGSDAGIVGKTISLDDKSFEVIGVLPPGFRLRSTLTSLVDSALDPGKRALWVPMAFDGWGANSQDHEVVGRLVPGATLAQLRTELTNWRGESTASSEPGFQLTHPKDEVVSRHRASLHLLLGAATILLVIACANIAALLMSESLRRTREMATRMALGAGRLRVARQLLTESALLGAFGSALGIALALVGIPAFVSLAPPLPRLEEVGMNSGVLLFSILAGVGGGVMFGLAPAFRLQASRLRLAAGTGGRGFMGSQGRYQRSLIAAELALTMVLLVVGGLLIRSLVNLAQVDTGFDATGVATVRVHFPAVGEAAARREVYQQMVARVQSIPGVVQAGAVDGLPFPGRVTGTTVRIEGRATDGSGTVTARNHFVVPGYVETMRIPLVAGRTLTRADARASSPPVMLINEKMARQHWSGGDSPLGARIRDGNTVYEVVGIVGDVRERHLAEDPKDMFYRVGPGQPSAMSIVARTDADPEDLIQMMRQAIWAVNPNMSLSQESTMAGLIERSTGAERYRAMLVVVFGVLAALLVSVGVFGVTAHTVSTRTREMGIRMALGGQRGDLIRSVMFAAMVPSALGLGIGLLGALAASRLLTSYLFGVEPWDTKTVWGVVVLLGSLSLAAAGLPARRIRQMDPMNLLRVD